MITNLYKVVKKVYTNKKYWPKKAKQIRTSFYISAIAEHLELCRYIMKTIGEKKPSDDTGSSLLHFLQNRRNINMFKYIMEIVQNQLEDWNFFQATT